MLRNKIFFVLALVWTCTIAFFSLISLNKIHDPYIFPHKDKIVHFIFYFVFVILWCLWLQSSKYKKPIVIIFLIAIFFGTVIEILQGYLTTYRTLEALDIIANTLGATMGYIFANKIKSNKKSHNS